ncbi:MAG: hypothetical protein EAZ27_09010 [Cytophagales bacterium]|nr:MAG: hypothetical protein EAZ27_09010 [Cytophagales bacterium]
MGLKLKYLAIIAFQLITFQIMIAQSVDLRSKNDNVVPSPYGQLGFGDIDHVASTRHAALANTGIALPNIGYVNMINPALTAYNNQNVIFDAGITVQHIKIQNSKESQYNTGANFHYFNILFPVSSKFWSSFIGLAPMSSANSSFQEKIHVQGSVKDTLYQRSKTAGGLTKFYMTHGFKLPKNFAIGVNFSYVFGNISHSDVSNIDQNSFSIYKSKEVYKLLDMNFGLSYYKKINESHRLFLGSTFGFCTDLGSKDSLSLTQNTYSSQIENYVPHYNYTTSNSGKVNVGLPPKIGFGIALEKSNKYNIALDYTYTIWSRMATFTNDKSSFSDAHRISLGAEFLPNQNALKGYLNRMVYRAGIFYHATPYFIQNTKINEFGITAGAGFPLGKSMLSTLNISFQLGQRGTISNNLVKENYFKIFLGINISDRWFTKYKLD